MVRVNKEKSEKNWREIIKEQEGVKPEAYVLYLRRSRKQRGVKGEDDEKPEGIDKLSIEQQREACEYTAEKRSLIIEKTFEEEIPAKKPRTRPQFRAMMEYIESSPRNLGILAWAPDRLARNAVDSGEIIQNFLDKKIIDFQFVTYHFTQDETGVEYLMMELARAMGYSLRLRKNVLRGMHKGYFDYKEWQFPPKFGYDRLLKKRSNGKTESINFLVPYERTKEGYMSEFETIKLAFELRLKGLPYEKIAQEINKIGFITKKGKIGNMTKQK